MRTVRHKRLVLALIVALLATRAVCVCAAPPSAATVTAAPDPHACCHGHAAPAHHERRGATCQHCSHAQLTPPDAFAMAAPAWTVVPFRAAAVVTGSNPLARPKASARDAERPPPTTLRPCVLLI